MKRTCVCSVESQTVVGCPDLCWPVFRLAASRQRPASLRNPARNAASGGGGRRHGDGRDARPGGWPSRRRQQGEAHAEVVRSARAVPSGELLRSAHARAQGGRGAQADRVHALRLGRRALGRGRPLQPLLPMLGEATSPTVACRCASPAPHPPPSRSLPPLLRENSRSPPALSRTVRADDCSARTSFPPAADSRRATQPTNDSHRKHAARKHSAISF